MVTVKNIFWNSAWCIRSLFVSFSERAWIWMDPIVEEAPAEPAFPAWNLWVGGKCLIAIYLPSAAFDTHDEPASFDCHLLRRQDSSAHTLLSADFSSVHALCLYFLPRLCILREAPTQDRLLSFVIVGRATEPPTQPHPQREAGMPIPLKKHFLNKRDSPMCWCAWWFFLSHHIGQNSQIEGYLYVWSHVLQINK